MNKIKVGIIGTGVGIRTHLKGFRDYKEIEVYAISGSSIERSKKFASEYNIPVACEDYKKLCDIEELDLVCITAPNKFHKEMLEYAISKKKNIICEKPVVDTLELAKEINETAKNYDKLLIVNHQLRFNPYIKKIKELIDNDILGKIYNIKIKQQGTGFANENAKWTWSFDAEEGGGVRLAMASHLTDLIQYWFGEKDIISILASMNPITKIRDEKVVLASTTCDALIKLEDELTIQYSINAGSYSGSKFDISIFGDKGELNFSLKNKLKLYLRSNVGVEQVIEVKDVYEDERENKVSIFSGSFRYLIPKVIDAIIENKNEIKDAATIKDSLYCLKVLDAIKESSNRGVGISFKEENNLYC